MSDEPDIALLDACVLAPLVVRAALLAAARAGAFRPRWSVRIEDEWRAALAKPPNAPPPALIDGEIALARAAFPDALAQGWEALEGPLSLPDWNDRHVLAAAIAADADVLVTDNLRDFPTRVLAGHGLRRETADAFLWRLLGEREAQMAQALARLEEETAPLRQGATLPALLKKARLPRFAKAAAAVL